jgi:hypothetical protein
MEAITNYRSLFSLLTLINKAKLYFTVSDGSGKLTPSQLGFGYFEYWQKG